MNAPITKINLLFTYFGFEWYIASQLKPTCMFSSKWTTMLLWNLKYIFVMQNYKMHSFFFMFLYFWAEFTKCVSSVKWLDGSQLLNYSGSSDTFNMC